MINKLASTRRELKKTLNQLKRASGRLDMIKYDDAHNFIETSIINIEFAIEALS